MTINTTAGTVAYLDTKGSNHPLLLIHRNSGCKELFQHQVDGLKNRFRIITFDLPGHGKSEAAESYSIPLFADVAMQVANHLELKRYAVVGWELGGHIALEMLHKAAPISKLMLVSTVPIEFSAQGISKGYKLNRRDYELLQKDTFSKVEAAEYLEDLNKTWMVDAAMKVDSKMRPQLFQSMKDGRSEIATVQEHSDKIHLIFGQKDRKWDFGHVTAIRGTTPLTSIEGGINTPWTNSEIFNEALSMFLEQ